MFACQITEIQYIAMRRKTTVFFNKKMKFFSKKMVRRARIFFLTNAYCYLKCVV